MSFHQHSQGYKLLVYVDVQSHSQLLQWSNKFSCLHGMQRIMISCSGQFFRIFEIIIFALLLLYVTCDLVDDMITIFHISYALTASENVY